MNDEVVIFFPSLLFTTVKEPEPEGWLDMSETPERSVECKPTGSASYGVEVIRDMRVPLAPSGLSLSADLYLPFEAPPSPAIVTILPYRKDFGSEYERSMRWFAAHGYPCVVADHQGIGSSDGSPHPASGPGEAADAVRLIEWSALQPWCDGSVGMWGASHGGFTTLSAARTAPPALKAIIALVNALDPERDIMHPDGARGDFDRLASWGGMMLAQQLAPPLLNHWSLAEQARWHHRMREVEPYLLALAKQGPGDPAWSDKVLDASTIAIPCLCVGGWGDLFSDSVPRTWEQLVGPKHLLMGPWGHTLPQDSPVGAVDFLSLALRWWDHWLRGEQNGLEFEDPVKLYLGGSDPSWHSFPSWPPTCEKFGWRSDGATLLPSGQGSTSEPAENALEYLPDATIGALRGFAHIAMDQHDDDVRSASVTSEPLAKALRVVGRVEVVVGLDPGDAPPSAPRRVVVRLTEVDQDGRSRYITSGVTVSNPKIRSVSVVLRATAYSFRAGARLRVAISDSDFPRLMPLVEPVPLRVTGVSVNFPVMAAETEHPIEMPEAPGPTSALRLAATSTTPGPWRVLRDPVKETVEVIIASSGSSTTAQGHQLTRTREIIGRVQSHAPEAAEITATHSFDTVLSDGRQIIAVSRIRCSQAALWVEGEVLADDRCLFSRRWEILLDQHDHIAISS